MNEKEQDVSMLDGFDDTLNAGFDEVDLPITESTKDADLEDKIDVSEDVPKQPVKKVDGAPSADSKLTKDPEAKAKTEPEAKENEHTEKKFSQDEVNQLIEKRLAREKSAAEKQMKAHPVLSYIEKMAQQNGMTVEAMMATWEQQEVEKLADTQGITTEAARRLRDAEARAAKLEAELNDTRTAVQKQIDEKNEFEAFVLKFPEVDATKIPEEVWESRVAGKTLEQAYTEYAMKSEKKTAETELQKLKDELAGIKQQMETMKKAPLSGGGGVSDHGSENHESEDPFLRGFESF